MRVEHQEAIEGLIRNSNVKGVRSKNSHVEEVDTQIRRSGKVVAQPKGT